MKKNCRLKYFPVSFFSIILGMTGFTIALQKIESILETTFKISPFSLIITSLIFLTISFLYLIKIIKYKKETSKEFRHPIKISFFPTFSVSLLLLSIAFLEINMSLSKYLWISGVLTHFVLTLKIISTWIHQTQFNIKHMNPAWFIPAVGNIVIPIAGITHFHPEISWFFFSIGLILWIILLTIFFYRIIFHKPLSNKLLPTLFILIAPPAVGFISLVKLIGKINEFSKIMYYFALFLIILLFSQIRIFFKLKYYLSWWAYLFPISSITIASILMFHQTSLIFFKNLSLTFFFISCNLLIFFSIKTIQAIINKEICIEEE